MNALRAAFDLVDPGLHAKQLAERGLIRKADAERVTWRDPIAALVADVELHAAGVSIDQVKRAIAHYTATEATVETCLMAHPTLGTTSGYLVTAAGYRNGPAGP